jgi:hypothetical protein
MSFRNENLIGLNHNVASLQTKLERGSTKGCASSHWILQFLNAALINVSPILDQMTNALKILKNQ